MSRLEKEKRIISSWQIWRDNLRKAHRRKLAHVKTDEEKKFAGRVYQVILADGRKEEQRELARL